MTPRQLRDAANRPWAEEDSLGSPSAPADLKPGDEIAVNREPVGTMLAVTYVCPRCRGKMVARDKLFNTADSDINVLVCNRFRDGFVLCCAHP